MNDRRTWEPRGPVAEDPSRELGAYHDVVPTTSPGAHGTDPFDQARVAARELGRLTGAERHDVMVVLGSGLSGAAESLGAGGPPVDLTALPWFPRFTGPGHRPEAWSVEIGTRRVLLVAGRLHLYEGRTPAEVVHGVRTAIAAGCRIVVLTGIAGAINPAVATGDLVVVSDHLNLTGTSPLRGIPGDHAVGLPFVDLTDAWTPRLRALARRVEPSLKEGVYAQMPGPHFETPAEIRLLATGGADLVGMSMVPELIAARHLGAETLGLVVATNPAAGLGSSVEAGEIMATGGTRVDTVARVVRGVVELLGPPEEDTGEAAD